MSSQHEVPVDRSTHLAGGPITLHRCSRCQKSEDEQCRLKACSRCQARMYCSKECQKAEWSTHKYNCYAKNPDIPESISRTRNLDAQMNGFRSADQFKQILTDFYDAHSWTLLHYVKAVAMLDSDPEYANTLPNILEIKLRSTYTRGSSYNPAQTFKLQGYCWRTIEQYTSNPFHARIWQETARLREVAHRNRSDDPQFVGILPVHYAIDDMVYCNKLLFHFLLRQRPCSMQNIRTREETPSDILNKARKLFVNSINLGIALRFVDGQESLAVLPGRYVRLNRRWTWEPLFTDWNEYLTGPGGIEEVDALLEPFTDESARSSVPGIFDLIHVL